MGKWRIFETLKLKLNGGDDDGERVWIELNMLKYDATSDLQH
jgi:hypothetical protein